MKGKVHYMRKIKVLVAGFLLSFLVFAAFKEKTVLVLADETQSDIIYDAGYDLVVEDGNIVEVSKDGTVIIKAEYEDGVRVLKKGQYSSQFTYEGICIVNEVRDGKSIEYLLEYDENYNAKYSGFIYEENTYHYIWNEGKIVAIKDESENEIARYDYDSLQVVGVLKLAGDEWQVNNDADFIGNFNKIRSYGAYYDDETGWYYSNGVYNDVCENKIVGLKDNNPHYTETNPFPETWNEGIMLFGYEVDDYEAEMLAEELLSSSSFNAAKTDEYYSKTSKASTEEIIARLIYGENNTRTLDQRAIAWVLLNRYHYNPALFGATLRDVAIKDGAFAGLKNPAAKQAQNPSDSKWSNAVYLACLICTNDTEACWNSISPKPTGITNQTYFRSADSLGESGGIFEKNGVLYAYYKSGSVAIENVCIAGKGTATTIKGLEAYCTEGAGNYNVFFYHKN